MRYPWPVAEPEVFKRLDSEIKAAWKIQLFYKDWKVTRKSYVQQRKDKARILEGSRKKSDVARDKDAKIEAMKKKFREANREAEYLCGNWGRRCGDPVSTQAHNDLNRLRELIRNAIDATN